MKKLVYLFGLFLLIAGLTACSSDYDDPPEQPGSHQQEEPTDSIGVHNDTTEVDSTAYTVISAVPVSEEVKAFFDKEMPMTDEYFNNVPATAFDLEPERRLTIPAYPVYIVFNSEEEMKERYLGAEDLPEIDFGKYTVIVGECYLGSFTILESFLIEVYKYFDHNELVIKTKTTSKTGWHPRVAHSCFWGLFPKIEESFNGFSWEEEII